jgi:hypothetical protein
MKQSQNGDGMIAEIAKNIFIQTQRARDNLHDGYGKLDHGVVVLVHDATEAFRVGDFGGILVRSLAEASLDNVYIIEWEVLSKIEAFFQIAFCAFFEVLRA